MADPAVAINKTRVSDIAEVIRLQGLSTGSLLKYCTEKYGISERQSYSLIKRARKALVEDFEDLDRKELMATQVHRYEILFERALAEKCYSSAVGALNSLNGLLGLGFHHK